MAGSFGDAKAAAFGRINKAMGPEPSGNPFDSGDDAPTDDAGGVKQGDSETGYVEVSGGPKCGNCNYLQGTHCSLPQVDKDVSATDGCCNFWDDGSGQPGILTPEEEAEEEGPETDAAEDQAGY